MRKYRWFLILEIGLCLFYMIPGTEIVTERQVSSLEERDYKWSDLPQERKWVIYTLLAWAQLCPCRLVLSDTGKMI